MTIKATLNQAARIGCALLTALAVSTPTLAGPLSPAPVVQSAPAAPPIPTPTHPLTAPDIEAWLDGLMPSGLSLSETPGAVVVVVKDGQVLFEKGYGYADYKAGKPVDAKTTLFRPGSVSKLFTWTAVMQQVELGKINLDADVNTYLDFHIPAYKGQPVTMRNLMTHRGGFSETARDLLTYGKAAPPLDSVLKRYVPPRIFLPDGGPGYSNYGASVAGYIVQRVSGEEFNSYIQHHIFAPLNMQHATFDQPLPASLAPDMAKGYSTWDKPGPGFEIISMPPAGSLSATGDDMAHFMIAHLQNGKYGDTQILKPETAQMMHTSVTKAFPDLNGNLLGFYQQNINGHRVIAHGGDTDFFHSDLTLWLDDNVGVFVSVNGRGKEGMGEFLRDRLFAGFADRYFPAPPVTARVDDATAKQHAAMIAGAYGTTRGSRSTFLAAIALIGPNVVKDNGDGTITAAPLGIPEIFFETSPYLWQQLHGHDRIEATVNDGKVTRWSSDSAAPIFVYERPTGFASTGLEMPLLLASLALLLLTALLWPIVAFARSRYGKTFAFSGNRAVSYRLVRIAAIVGVVSLGLWFEVLQIAEATNGMNIDVVLHLAQLCAFLGFAGGFLAALWNLALTFRPGGGSWFSKLYAVLLTGAFAMMLWIGLHYHLIGVGKQF